MYVYTVYVYKTRFWSRMVFEEVWCNVFFIKINLEVNMKQYSQTILFLII